MNGPGKNQDPKLMYELLKLKKLIINYFYIKMMINEIMTMESKFNATTTYCDVNTLIAQVNQKENAIDLNPSYQRGIVWNDEKQSAFINSVMRGIVPNAIIINYEDLKKTCMDGKQRLTSLVRFKNNEITCTINEEILYYDHVNNKNENGRVMTGEEKTIFYSRNLPVVTYYGLNYEDQIDVFNRIQNGVSMKAGEIISSLFINSKINEFFNIFCESKRENIEKFIKNNKSKQHKIIIVNVIYLIENEILKLPSKNQRCNFIKTKLNKMSLVTAATKKISFVIDIAFGSDVLNHSSIINVKMNQATYYAIIDLLYTNKKINYKKLRSAIRNYCRKKSKEKDIETIQKNILKIYNKTSIDEVSDEEQYEEIDSEYTKNKKTKKKITKKKILLSDDESDD